MAVAQNRECPKVPDQSRCIKCLDRLKTLETEISQMHATYATLTSNAQAAEKQQLKADIATKQASYDKEKARCTSMT